LLRVSLLKHITSYLIPVRIWKGSSTENPVLELFLYRGQWQLGTEDAIYSDGDRYRPMIVGFNSIGRRLEEARDVLVLGAGLGSAVAVLKKMGFHPAVTLVDIDDKILDWARTLHSGEGSRLTFICADAQSFVAAADQQYDVVVIDVFKGRNLPAFIDDPSFLKDCRQLIRPAGHLIINYMINDRGKWEGFKEKLSEVFPDNKVLTLNINRVVVATV
jgi:spermidine synthase